MCLDTSHNFMTVSCPWPARSVSLFQPRSLHSLTQFSCEFCHSCLDMGHLTPDCGLPSHLQYWKSFSLSQPGGIQCPRKDFMLTGWLAEPGFGPINSSDECLCSPLSFQLRADRVRFVFPQHTQEHSLNWALHPFICSFIPRTHICQVLI